MEPPAGLYAGEMGNFIRVSMVLVLIVATGASATAPAKHTIHKTKTISATYDATWGAVIDLVAERGWAISNMAKDSGLITTDWMSIENDTPYADCGEPGLSSVQGTDSTMRAGRWDHHRQRHLGMADALTPRSHRCATGRQRTHVVVHSQDRRRKTRCRSQSTSDHIAH